MATHTLKYWKDGQPVIIEESDNIKSLKYWKDGTPFVWYKPKSKITYPETITFQARIKTENVLKTLASQARIKNQFVKVSTGSGRIKRAKLNSLDLQGRIKATSTKSISSSSDIQKTISKNILSHSRLSKSLSSISRSKARLKVTSYARVSALLGVVLKKLNEKVLIKSRIKTYNLKHVSSEVRIRSSYSKYLKFGSRLKISNTRYIKVLSRFKQTYKYSLNSLSRIKKHNLATISGRSRNLVNKKENIKGISRIKILKNVNLKFGAKVIKRYVNILSPKSRIKKVSIRSTSNLRSRVKKSKTELLNFKTLIKQTYLTNLNVKFSIIRRSSLTKSYPIDSRLSEFKIKDIGSKEPYITCSICSLNIN